MSNNNNRLSNTLPERYLRVIEMMWEGQWLHSYRKLNNIGYALENMSKRSPRLAPLPDCFEPIQIHYDELMGYFLQLYPDVLNASQKKARELEQI
ncbi:ACP phosphodiesterase [Vibrio sp.]|nr:ACP phosphodiesterase [Vibrio sp.]